MSIASEITRINNNISNAYTVCNNKGATMPQIQNSANLATTIASISGGTVSGVKKFDTISEMKTSTENQDGDLALVYSSPILPLTENTSFQIAYFPSSVELDEAISSEYSYSCEFLIEGGSAYGGVIVTLTNSRFRFYYYYREDSIIIEYTSSDGQTYTRTDSNGDPVDFGKTLIFGSEYGSQTWNDNLGDFIQTSSPIFTGLYKYGTYTENNRKKIMNLETKEFLNTNFIIPDEFIGKDNGGHPALMIVKTYHYNNVEKANVIDTCDFIPATGIMSYNSMFYRDIPNSKYYAATTNTSPNTAGTLYHYDFTGNTPTYTTETISTTTITVQDKSLHGVELSEDLLVYCDSGSSNVCVLNTYENGGWNYERISCPAQSVNTYKQAPTQLNCIKDYVLGKTFYGSNGVETGELANAVSNNFDDLNAKLYLDISNLYENMQIKVLGATEKLQNTNIYFIPTKTNGTPLIDASNLTTAQNLFSSCVNLRFVPELNTPNITSTDSMFQGCLELTKIGLFDTSNVTNANYMFAYCNKLKEIPQFVFSNVTTMNQTFSYCSALETVPQLNLSKVTNLWYCFNYCGNLTSESLHNIIKSLLNTRMSSNKSLKSIGLSQTQATTCTSFSEWTQLAANGWTTGF